MVRKPLNPEEIKPEGIKPEETKPEPDDVIPIAKPSSFSLDGFRSKRSASICGVETLPQALPIYRIADAKDFVRLHPDGSACWSDELCFVQVPTKGVKGGSLLHLILEDLACAYLPEGKIIRHRLALATKPDDVFFLAEIPSANLDNSWNASTLRGGELAKTRWVQLVSQKKDGIDQYKIDFSHHEDAFPEPNWLKQPLADFIGGAFSPNRIINDKNHPGLLRLIGARQPLK
jgi:hypothetical protein